MKYAFDAIRFFRDHNIVYATDGKNVRPDWVHIRCPFCDDRSNHLGVNPSDGSVACWRCKSGSLVALVGKLLRLPYAEAGRLIEDYQGAGIVNRKSQIVNRVRRTQPIEIPGGDLSGKMRAYIEGRGFDPDYLVKTYGIKGLGFGGVWEGVDFSYRIVIPVYDRNGRLVSFQARDWTGKQELRYKNCPVEKSIIDPKDLLYSAHLANRNRVVVVEGIFDMWRMGAGFVCSFGTSMRESQIRLLSEWKEVIFLYDDEPDAQGKAMAYAQELSSVGVQCSVVAAQFGVDERGEARDPGDLSETEAAEVRRELLM